MTFHYDCVQELKKHDLYIETAHMTRFSDLVACYSSYPFFTPGLVKCMYLSSWDEDHYFIMLDILNDMTLSRSRDTEEMVDNGITMETNSSGRDAEILRLSGCFLTGEEFVLNPDNLDEEGRKIIRYTMKAAEIIDAAFEE